jgi:hypothetical protein
MEHTGESQNLTVLQIARSVIHTGTVSSRPLGARKRRVPLASTAMTRHVSPYEGCNS